MKIGFLGPEGTFSEEAGQLYCKKLEDKAELVPYPTFNDILLAADKGKIHEAIVPIENSMEGTIGIVTDMLAKEVDLLIKQELVLPVYHYLLAQKGVKLSEVTDIISHPQPIDQCKDYLQKHFPKAKFHLAFSTSQASYQAATSHKGFAAIANIASAKLYGLNILASKINVKDNKTRFVVLAKRDHVRTGKDKTSIVFSIPKDRPGGLHDALAVFAQRNINLTKIESRPSKKALGDYLFFADMEGHKSDQVVAQALKELKQKSSFFKFLGSYPKAVAS